MGVDKIPAVRVDSEKASETTPLLNGHYGKLGGIVEDDHGKLKLSTQLMYGAGTCLNDMTAAIWFSYLLYFLQEFRGLAPTDAATVILVGQIADAVLTPIAGQLSDRTETRIGKRMPWIIAGAFMMASSFAVMFYPWPRCSSFISAGHEDLIATTYYSFLGTVYNFGWACVGVSHMSLVPSLTPHEHERLRLNSIRWGFTVSSNLLVFLLASVIFRVVDDTIAQFQYLAIIASAIGSSGVLLCVLGVREPKSAYEPTRRASTWSQCSTGEVPWTFWFKKRLFYQMGFVYMCARIVVVLVQVAMPFYLVHGLRQSTEAIAWGPLTLQVASLGASFLVPSINARLGSKPGFAIGVVLVAAGCVAMSVLPPLVRISQAYAMFVYPFAFFAGAGTASMAVTAMTYEAVVVAKHAESGAFVYGAYGFLEKLSGGIAIYVLEAAHQMNTASGTVLAVAYIPLTASLLSLLVVLLSKLKPGQSSLASLQVVSASPLLAGGHGAADSLALPVPTKRLSISAISSIDAVGKSGGRHIDYDLSASLYGASGRDSASVFSRRVSSANSPMPVPVKRLSTDGLLATDAVGKSGGKYVSYLVPSSQNGPSTDQP